MEDIHNVSPLAQGTRAIKYRWKWLDKKISSELSSISISASAHNVLTCITGGKADVRDLGGSVHVRCSSSHVVDDIWTSILDYWYTVDTQSS